MEEFQIPPASATTLPVADVRVSPADNNQMEYEAYAVRKPEEDLNDFKIQVRASTLTRCRAKLEQINTPEFPWHEGALALSMAAAGAFFTALPAEIKAGSTLGVLFYTVFPVIAVAAFVAYFFLRRSALREPADVVAGVLKELPDPSKAR